MQMIAVEDDQLALLELQNAIHRASPADALAVFSDAADALSFAGKNRVDTAFLDIHLGEMSGIHLARELKRRNPRVNVVFVTAHENYWQDAINLHCSGYILKPVTDRKIRDALDNLLYPEHPQVRFYAKTFGNFDLLVDGRPVAFQRDRAKELLACLVDRCGASVSKRELAAQLFEDTCYSRKQQQYFTKIYGFLIKSLQAVDAECLIIKQPNSYAVDNQLLRCDAWDYLKGEPEAENAFRGEYMNQYSWAETELYRFQRG